MFLWQSSHWRCKWLTERSLWSSERLVNYDDLTDFKTKDRNLLLAAPLVPLPVDHKTRTKNCYTKPVHAYLYVKLIQSSKQLPFPWQCKVMEGSLDLFILAWQIFLNIPQVCAASFKLHGKRSSRKGHVVISAPIAASCGNIGNT